MPDQPRYTNIADIRRANKKAGRFWFSPDTLKHFASRVESRVYEGPPTERCPQGSRLWVESTRNYDDTCREFKIARFDVEDHDIGYAHVEYRILHFDTAADAVTFLESNLL